MTDSLLFSPLRLNSVVVPNRVWLPAMVTWLSNDAGEVTDDVRARYVRYARGGAGMIVLEAMGIRDVASVARDLPPATGGRRPWPPAERNHSRTSITKTNAMSNPTLSACARPQPRGQGTIPARADR